MFSAISHDTIKWKMHYPIYDICSLGIHQSARVQRERVYGSVVATVALANQNEGASCDVIPL